jgi:hypothetical protein
MCEVYVDIPAMNGSASTPSNPVAAAAPPPPPAGQHMRSLTSSSALSGRPCPADPPPLRRPPRHTSARTTTGCPSPLGASGSARSTPRQRWLSRRHRRPPSDPATARHQHHTQTTAAQLSRRGAHECTCSAGDDDMRLPRSCHMPWLRCAPPLCTRTALCGTCRDHAGMPAPAPRPHHSQPQQPRQRRPLP